MTTFAWQKLAIIYLLIIESVMVAVEQKHPIMQVHLQWIHQFAVKSERYSETKTAFAAAAVVRMGSVAVGVVLLAVDTDGIVPLVTSAVVALLVVDTVHCYHSETVPLKDLY